MPDDESPAMPDPHDLRVSHMRYSELVSLTMQMRARADADWQRVITMHAALIAVMIFFANQQAPFLPARILVLAIYSYSVVMALQSLRETFSGLQALTQDLMLFPAPVLGGHALAWLHARSFRSHAIAHSVILIVAWLVVSWLLVGGLLFGHRPLQF